MIFDRYHSPDLTGRVTIGATSLVLLHCAVYGGLALTSVPLPMTALVFAVLLIGISVSDIQSFEIPDSFSVLLAVTGALTLWLTDTPAADHIIAAIGFSTLLYIVGVLYLRFRGHPGLGFGDVKLALGLGLWLGGEGSVWTLMIASLSAIATIVTLSVARRSAFVDLHAKGVAFGPFLCLSAWAVWLHGVGG